MPWITGEPAEMWEAARSTDALRRRRALNFWARNLNILPGPLFFELDPNDVLKGEWQRAVEKSEPRCPCAARRWFIPTNSQPFYPADEPKLFTLGVGWPQLAITPWGGDAVATMLQLSVDNNGALVERMAPYSQLSQDQLQQIGHGTLEILERTAESVTGIWTAGLTQTTPLTEIAEQFILPFTPVPSVISVGPAGSTDAFEFRSFAIYDVNAAAGTVSVGISRNCQRANPADRARIHVCA